MGKGQIVATTDETHMRDISDHSQPSFLISTAVLCLTLVNLGMMLLKC
jgi:hypothetical protein